MSEILSQEEIQKMLLTIPSEPNKNDLRSGSSQKKIQYYEFNRPFSFTKSQRISISDIHDSFTRKISTLFSELLNTSSVLHVASVNEIFYEEFIRSIQNPSSITIIQMQPYPYSILFEIDQSLVHSIIDFLGGGNGQFQKKRPAITECELILLKQVLVDTLLPLKEMWQNRIDVHPLLKTIETNPGLVKIVSQDSMVLLVTIESQIGSAQGMINICYPASFIKAGYEIGKTVSGQEKNNYSKNNKEKLMYKKITQYSIDDFSLQYLASCKGEVNVAVSKNLKSMQKYIPVIRKEEDDDVR